ncbi:MAG: ABC transporter permease [Planctomycetes bacterium]|nr:ABC transporter permease [Planctomycetota bacterium]
MIAVRNLLRRRLRSLFALLQIAVAIAAFVSIVGVTKGLRGQFYRLGEVFAYDLVVQAAGAPSPIFSTVTREEAAKIAQVEGIESVSLMSLHAFRLDQLKQPVILLALDPGSELMSRHEVTRGRELRKDDTTQILVGDVMAEDLGIDLTNLTVGGGLSGPPPELKIMGGKTYQIVGVFRSPLSEVRFLSGGGIMNLQALLDESNGQPNMVFAHRKPGGRAVTPQEVRAAIAASQALAPAVSEAVPRLKGDTIEGFLGGFKQAELVERFAIAVLFLAALVSGIGVANTMLMSVFDRTREIGLLRAVGWSRGRIVLMIEAEGVILSTVGGLLGVPIGLVLIWASGQMVQLGWLSVELDPLLYVQAVGAATLIGLIGSAYPALRASYLEPTEALRYE